MPPFSLRALVQERRPSFLLRGFKAKKTSRSIADAFKGKNTSLLIVGFCKGKNTSLPLWTLLKEKKIRPFSSRATFKDKNQLSVGTNRKCIYVPEILSRGYRTFFHA